MALLAGCTGDVSGSEDVESDSPETLNGWREDVRAWRDWWRSRRDGGTSPTTRDSGVGPVLDAGAPSEPDPVEPDPVEPDPIEPGPTVGTCPNGQPQPGAAGLRIREVALYQTLKVSLYRDGAWRSQRELPVVQGKKALARVFVDTLPGYARHGVRGVLTVQNGADVKQIVDDRTIAAASNDADASSTFSFPIDGALLRGDTQLSVSLQETSCSATGGAARDTRLAASALNAQALGKLKVVLVPVNIGGRLPVTDAKQVDNIRNALLAFYPVPDVEVTVRPRPLVWTGALGASDQRQWSSLLNAVIAERRKDNVASDVYYYGIAKPTPTFANFCARGCIMGIAPQTTRVQPSAQAGLSVAYEDNQSYETIVHEIGHAHGRGHAPCVQGGSIAGVDQAFPVAGGATGVWGWDSRSNTFLPPTHKDVMGYCRPNWISGYTYSALAQRSQAVNERALLHIPLTGERWHHVLAFGDGTAQWGGAVETSLPGGELEPARALDASGAEVEKIEVVRVELSDSSDQFLYIPEPKASWASIALKDRTIELGKIAPAAN